MESQAPSWLRLAGPPGAWGPEGLLLGWDKRGVRAFGPLWGLRRGVSDEADSEPGSEEEDLGA